MLVLNDHGPNGIYLCIVLLLSDNSAATECFLHLRFMARSKPILRGNGWSKNVERIKSRDGAIH